MPTRILSLSLLLPLFVACKDGSLDLAIADAPVDGASAVVVQFRGVGLLPASGDELRFEFDPPRNIDLLALSGGDSELLLSDVAVEAGTYKRVRLFVNASRVGGESYVDTPQGRRVLYLPGDAESGLALEGTFEIQEREKSSYTLDVDLRRSVREPEDNTTDYVLRPRLRSVETGRSGAIGGSVAASRITANCSPAVYVYTGASVTPDDVGGSGVQPISSDRVRLQTTSGEYRYQVAFLPAGNYTAAFTCDAARDDPAANDTLGFTSRNAEVREGLTTAVNF